MKKALFTICLLCSFLGMQAQHQWSAGPRIGLNVATVRSQLIDFPTRQAPYGCNINIGVFGEYRIWNFAVETDLIYSVQSYKIGKSNNGYLLIPLKLKLYTPYLLEGLNLFAGPQLDLCVNRKGPIVLGGGISYYRNTQASITVGLGYRFKFGLDLTANYNMGLISNFIWEKKCLNNVFQIAVGWDLVRLFKK